MNNRRKPSRVDFNNYYLLLIIELDSDRFTNVELFNDTTQGSRTALSASMTSSNQFILRSGSTYGGHEISMYAMGANLVSENAAFVTAYNTYINSL